MDFFGFDNLRRKLGVLHRLKVAGSFKTDRIF